MIPAETLRGGFADPVLDSQSVFRGVLASLSRPGSVAELATCIAAPAPLAAATGAIALAIADDTTPIFLDLPLATGTVSAWIAFHTGAPIVADPQKAAIAFIANPLEMPPFRAFPLGSAEYPDRSATLILQVEGLGGGPALVLAGPGIDGEARIAPRGLPADFVARMRANRALFPRGVDLFLVAGRHIAGLPRSTRVAGGT